MEQITSIKLWELILIIAGSTGFWAFLTSILNNYKKKRDPMVQGLQALLHDRLFVAGKEYLLKGMITTAELENLTAVYESYHALGGNGTGTKIYNDCLKLKVDLDDFERKLP